MSWAGFAAIFALFFVTHSVPVRPAIKTRLSARLGSRGFGVAYSLLSLGMLALLIWAAGQAPRVGLWPQMPWQRHVVHLVMLAVCLILAFSVARPNPFSFGGAKNERFDARCAGIVRFSRHPVLLALALWAGAHLLVNGDLAHVLLFGVLGGFAIAGRALINRRKRRDWGADTWRAREAELAEAPLLQPPLSWSGAILRGIVGVGVFVVLLTLHPVVIGVSAF